MTKDVTRRQKQAKVLRIFRKAHRITGAVLFVFFFIVAITGLLLGWKKHSGQLIMPPTYKGTSSNLKDWLPIDSLYSNACNSLQSTVSAKVSLELDRMDIRVNKGMVKFIFVENNWEVQLDGATGKLLHVGQRHSDFIETIHDGSILDTFFNTGNGQIKLAYTNIMGIALVLFTITGFWLWYGPKRMKKRALSTE